MLHESASLSSVLEKDEKAVAGLLDGYNIGENDVLFVISTSDKNGALAYAICSGKDLISAVKFANAASSVKVESRYVLDGIPTLKEIEKRLEFFDK